MKRHAALAPLSREHHEALILCQLLKKNAPNYKGLPSDTKGKMEYATSFYKDHLRVHFSDEEKVFKQLKDISQDLDKQLDEIIVEHHQLHILFNNIPSTQAEDHLDIIGVSLEKHVRKEERVLFPLIEQQVDEETLRTIAQFLSH